MSARTACLAMCCLLATASFASAQNAALIQRGQKVYAEQKCSVCHSIGTAGNKKGPLDDVGSKLSEADIRMWITGAPEMAAKVKAERKPVMKSYTLSKDDLDALVAYLSSLKK